MNSQRRNTRKIHIAKDETKLRNGNYTRETTQQLWLELKQHTRILQKQKADQEESDPSRESSK